MSKKDFTGIKTNGDLPDPCEICLPADIKDFLGDYDDSLNSMLNDMEKATLSYESGNKSKENTDTIKRILHKIKGESSMVGIEEITELTHQAEFAFEELKEEQLPDMLFRYKDWLCKALSSIAEKV
ncbi:MAG: Hpt domain-containing protein [Planctomycetaceae bacterium]|nr:Hpt domain-containing protein [Planctomycetaceae bacterium]